MRKIIIGLGLLLLCSGCACTRYSDERVSIWRVSLAEDHTVSRMQVTSTPNGTTVKVGSLISEADVKEMIEAIKAAAVLIK